MRCPSISGALLLLSGLISVAANANQQPVSLLDVLSRAKAQHPYIMQFQAQVDESRGKRLAAEGAFDWQIEQESFSRTSGFYNGWFADQSISRRLGPSNAKISGGYRVSDGSFPVYEDINRTLSGGEANIKLNISLLRDRETDPYRTKLANADLAVLAAQEQQTLRLNQLLFDAGIAYLTWYQAYHQTEIYARLLKLSQDRRTAIEGRVNSGDLASITLTEFDATVLDREAQWLESQRKLLESARKLAFYMINGNQSAPSLDGATPVDDDLGRYLSTTQRMDLLNALQSHPQISLIDREIAQSRNTLQLADNRLLPQLDLEVRVANDIGSGSETLDGIESYVGLSFSVPLEQRAARGESRAADAKLNALKFKRQAMLEALRTDLEAAFIALQKTTKLFEVRTHQADVAEKLAQQEQKRFDLGDSDLFLLNSRESNAALARLKQVGIAVDMLRQQLFVLTLTAQLADLDLTRES